MSHMQNASRPSIFRRVVIRNLILIFGIALMVPMFSARTLFTLFITEVYGAGCRASAFDSLALCGVAAICWVMVSSR